MAQPYIHPLDPAYDDSPKPTAKEVIGTVYDEENEDVQITIRFLEYKNENEDCYRLEVTEVIGPEGVYWDESIIEEIIREDGSYTVYERKNMEIEHNW